MNGNIKNSIILLLKGGAIGVANIIPGVSGGTLAVILGIYDKLIESIAKFFSNPAKRKEYIFFLLKVFLGAGIAIGLLANTMDFLLREYLHQTIFLFMGLILGGIPAVFKAHNDMEVRPLRVLGFVMGAALVLALAFIGGAEGEGGLIKMQAANGTANMDPAGYFMIIISGFLAGGSMIVPGISGSFILVLLGQYATIIAAIKNMDVVILLLMGAGVAAGVLVFSKLIEFFLEKMPSATYYFVLGLIAASLFKIYPGLPGTQTGLIVCVAAFFAGSAGAYLLSKFKVS